MLRERETLGERETRGDNQPLRAIDYNTAKKHSRNMIIQFEIVNETHVKCYLM